MLNNLHSTLDLEKLGIYTDRADQAYQPALLTGVRIMKGQVELLHHLFGNHGIPSEMTDIIDT